MYQRILASEGSVQGFEDLPQELRAVFKTAWEIPLTCQLKLAAGRGPFIDQSVSQNVNLTDGSVTTLWRYHMKAWRLGLKTSSYYTRIKPKAKEIKFGLAEGVPPQPGGAPPTAVRSASAECAKEEACEACVL